MRIMRSAREMGLATVAVYSDADRLAPFVRFADEAVHIGGPASSDSYLRGDRVIEACRATGADAIHPGYGFLSENANFARQVAEAGIIFIGPTPEAMEVMGSKLAAKNAVKTYGIPLVPGTDSAIENLAEAIEVAKEIGFPLLIKASAGGGGKGMRIVEEASELESQMKRAISEAESAFGDGAVFVERYVSGPRHIEIQVLADQHGNVVHLFERECSIQRRHQKVVEEAPSSVLTPEMRESMGKSACDVARACNYVGAGTVEFLLDDRMNYYFLEMNTRLQVEHPVTEAITGLDLVEWQLRVASGDPLPLQQHELCMQGHAIEARICAENPDNQFLPATGTLNVYRKPAHTAFERSAVRVDDGVREGDAISPFYDSMVAKLIVHGDNREQALARLDAALAETRIVGLATNVQFLRLVAASESFAQAKLDTALIPREAAVLFQQDRVGRDQAVAAAVAQTLLTERAAEGADPFSRRDGFRSHGLTVRRFDFEYQGEGLLAYLTYERGGALMLKVGETTSPLAFDAVAGGSRFDLQYAGQRQVVQTWTQGEMVHVFTPKGATQILEIDALAHAGEAAHEGGRLTAPMPGKVVSFSVKAGDTVTKGQPLAVMEAMKMEHTIAAPADGTVAELLYAPGDQVNEGAELLRLATA